MWPIEEHFRIILGGNTYINILNLVVYKGSPLFDISRRENDGKLGISFNLFDQIGKKIAVVRNDRIYLTNRTVNSFRIDYPLNQYIMTDTRTNREICKILIRSEADPAELNVSAVMYMPDGFLAEFSPAETNLSGSKMFGNTIANSPIGINIYENGEDKSDNTEFDLEELARLRYQLVRGTRRRHISRNNPEVLPD
jgi:hypothetical protein